MAKIGYKDENISILIIQYCTVSHDLNKPQLSHLKKELSVKKAHHFE